MISPFPPYPCSTGFQYSLEMLTPRTNCLRERKKSKLGKGCKKGRKNKTRQGWRDTQSFIYGKAADFCMGKRGHYQYIARNTQATLTLVKKVSMEWMKEQMNVQTMWIQGAIIAKNRRTWGILDWCKEHIPQMLCKFSLVFHQDQAHSPRAQTAADPFLFKHTWCLSLLHIHLLVTLAPLIKK